MNIRTRIEGEGKSTDKGRPGFFGNRLGQHSLSATWKQSAKRISKSKEKHKGTTATSPGGPYSNTPRGGLSKPALPEKIPGNCSGKSTAFLTASITSSIPPISAPKKKAAVWIVQTMSKCAFPLTLKGHLNVIDQDQLSGNDFLVLIQHQLLLLASRKGAPQWRHSMSGFVFTM